MLLTPSNLSEIAVTVSKAKTPKGVIVSWAFVYEDQSAIINLVQKGSGDDLKTYFAIDLGCDVDGHYYEFEIITFADLFGWIYEQGKETGDRSRLHKVQVALGLKNEAR